MPAKLEQVGTKIVEKVTRRGGDRLKKNALIPSTPKALVFIERTIFIISFSLTSPKENDGLVDFLRISLTSSVTRSSFSFALLFF